MPMNSETLVKAPSLKVLKGTATSYHYSNQIPLSIWVRTASRILKHANSYASKDVQDQAFVLYTRFIDLFAYNLYRHPDLVRAKSDYQANKKTNEAKIYREYVQLRSKLPQLMEEAEKLGSALKLRYNEYQEKLKREETTPDRQRLIAAESRRPEPQLKSGRVFSDIELSRKLERLSDTSQSSVSGKRVSQLKYPEVPSTKSFEVAISGHENSIQVAPVASPLTHPAINSTEGRSPLRTIFLPSELINNFLDIASHNTQQGMETCGLLCGKLNRNAFFVTYLVIPEQTSTPNTCSTKNEEHLFDVIDQLDLFILGWIHTHPTQSCFLSSVDLHTQNSYQIMLNEAVAVVCSPGERFSKKLGIFRLTDPPGIATITSCGKSGFHPHPEKNLYVECYRISKENAKSGHVVIKKGLPYHLKDLR
ncbi:hypothetical protein FOA43_000012 [Brettanomyces nanus]|uniref:Regulator of free ubiquitin chains 1 n=1 Tax=Eeniella nana TaxID=13502 RepID=A0A875RV95_EENNA|nr:uncharacterized protein FOA43_000012 [Brettanomyces nanus]QPG72711.1 hypothetical protein FOA43_000012 [Brettanomyces nanus]